MNVFPTRCTPYGDLAGICSERIAFQACVNARKLWRRRVTPGGASSDAKNPIPARWLETDMSRAFVREQDLDTSENLPERPISEHPNDVTQSGMAQIEDALAAAKRAYALAQASNDRACLAASLAI